MFDRPILKLLASTARLARTLRASALAFVVAASGFAFAGNGALDSVEVARAKLSADLLRAVDTRTATTSPWVNDAATGRLVKVLVMGDKSAASDLKDLRRDILAAGGSVYYRYISLTGVSAMLPASKVIDIARRKDVVRMLPNRPTSRTSSLVEAASGAGDLHAPRLGAPAGLDGSGVGIAFLDSGIMANHAAFGSGLGGSRVKKSVDLRKFTAAMAPYWRAGVDISADFYPGSATLVQYEAAIDNSGSLNQDPYGHGTAVAAAAAGRSFSSNPDTRGVASNANLFDMRVLDENGMGEVADALAAIDWVVFHAGDFGIRVINISFSADSTESYRTDPLCIAVRNAVAAGLTVVVAAGNYGLGPDGKERFGTIGSPGIEPSAITVGSSNPHATPTRADDTVNRFSSRGPTRGAWIDANGATQRDNVLKPDLVAPGNGIPTALAKDALGLVPNAIVRAFPQLVIAPGTATNGIMQMSGTSMAAPVVSGAVALMLQANPGLTPPLVKAMLQYSAEPLAQANLLQQGAGLVNAVGAVALADVIIPNLADQIGNKVKIGDSIIIPGKAFPAPESVVAGRTAKWSRFVTFGGRYLFSGEDLFRKFQAVYDPEFSWVGNEVLATDINYFKGQGHDYITGFNAGPVNGHKYQVVTAGVKNVTPVLGPSSATAQTGAFMPSANIAAMLGNGGGVVLADGIIIVEGIIVVEGIIITEGIIVQEGLIVVEGVTLANGIIVQEGAVVSEGIVVVEDVINVLLGEW
jgi:serine protease AprX